MTHHLPDSLIADLDAELARARAKFPAADGLMVALMEEVGELARALLTEPVARCQAEAIQVAAVALRIVMEGDPTLGELRRKIGDGGDS